MSGLFPPSALRVIEAPLRVPEARVQLGDALWLYVLLASIASYRGLVCRRPHRLAQDIGADEQQLAEWLDRLSKVELIEVQTPAPFLVIKLRAWSGSEPSESEKTPDSGHPGSDAHIDVPVSSNAAAAAALSKREDGGQGEGEALLREVLAALDEADPVEFRQLLQQYPPDVVRRALRRVETTPPSQIRKSKTALFRYLLTKLS